MLSVLVMIIRVVKFFLTKPPTENGKYDDNNNILLELGNEKLKNVHSIEGKTNKNAWTLGLIIHRKPHE